MSLAAGTKAAAHGGFRHVPLATWIECYTSLASGRKGVANILLRRTSRPAAFGPARTFL